jgi:hypothetical protein
MYSIIPVRPGFFDCGIMGIFVYDYEVEEEERVEIIPWPHIGLGYSF